MSAKATAWAWSIEGLGMADKIVLLRLADHANDQGICWPGKDTLAKVCCASKRTVDAAIANLEAAKLISVQRRRTEQGKNKSNMYELHLDQGDLFSSANSAVVQNLQDCKSSNLGVQNLQGEGAAFAPESPIEPKTESIPVGTGKPVEAKTSNPQTDLKTAVWSSGVRLLTGQGMRERQARALLGKVAKQIGSDADVLEVIRLAEGKADAASFLTACAFKIRLPTDNRALWSVRDAVGLPTYYDDLDQCHAEIRQHLHAHPEYRAAVEALVA
jgi:Helix-turn-helix domain